MGMGPLCVLSPLRESTRRGHLKAHSALRAVTPSPPQESGSPVLKCSSNAECSRPRTAPHIQPWPFLCCGQFAESHGSSICFHLSQRTIMATRSLCPVRLPVVCERLSLPEGRSIYLGFNLPASQGHGECSSKAIRLIKVCLL